MLLLASYLSPPAPQAPGNGRAALRAALKTTRLARTLGWKFNACNVFMQLFCVHGCEINVLEKPNTVKDRIGWGTKQGVT